MGITKEVLLNEQAHFEQQIAQKKETIQRADAVKATAITEMTAYEGALATIQHLLKKLEAPADEPQPATKEQTDDQ